jgi:succinate-semialdehyde dehydrogenase/glutarate-semialdehyde dehydrogenase
LFRRAGAPAGVFQTLLMSADRVERLIGNDIIAAVTLTGSEAAGRSVAAGAGRCIKPTVLELGGSDPFVVLASADVPDCAAQAARARTVNNGQSCIASKRFIVVEDVAEEFEAAFTAHMAALRVGDPMDESTDVGPLATAQVLSDVEKQVSDSIAMGARATTGARRGAGPGYFYMPTVLVDAPLHSPVATEEVFGPVAPVFRVRDSATALALANSTRFGLGASVWTRDASEAQLFAEGLECGMVFVNAVVHSDARFPFGGVKSSGYGRELGDAGMLEFVNVKTVRVRGVQAG